MKSWLRIKKEVFNKMTKENKTNLGKSNNKIKEQPAERANKKKPKEGLPEVPNNETYDGEIAV